MQNLVFHLEDFHLPFILFESKPSKKNLVQKYILKYNFSLTNVHDIVINCYVTNELIM